MTPRTDLRDVMMAGFVFLATLIVIALGMAVLVVMTGCTYTHPSKSSPDLVERIASGHVICYYRNGPDRGYAKCCPECPMHDTVSITTGGKP